MTDDGSPECWTEAVAVFDDAQTLQAAIDDLLSQGFDRAEISLLATEDTVERTLGHLYSRVEDLEDDPKTARTAYVSRESVGDAEGGLIGGLFYIGAVTATGAVLAGGGAIGAAIAAAAAVGGAGGLIGLILARMMDRRLALRLQQHLDRGGLLLWVRTRDPDHENRARALLTRHGGRDVHLHALSRTR